MGPTKDEAEIEGRSAGGDLIAIVGMAMRLPGKVRNAEDFWRLLVEKRSGLCEVPPDRYNSDAFHDPDGKLGTIRAKQGYFLQEVDIRQFDNTVFTTSKKELQRLDPEQRQLLEVVYECFENAGTTSWRGSKVGCYVGVFGEDWLDLNAKETQHMGGYRFTGYGDFVLSNRVSYEFDLHGPSMTVKTGCSSSLVCLDLACKAIRAGDCESALVCGTSLIFSPTMTLALSDQGLLSPTGTCKTFDAAADGYARGEALNAVYIKKASQAIQDGDHIRAIIRGTRVNCDGRTQGMTIPSTAAQEALIRETYEACGLYDVSQTALVECHGTGTPVGDPREAAAVANCFGEKGVIIMSVKPNVGHSEGAAGLTSLIKAVLALQHCQVPPNINFDHPNPDIPFERSRLHVPTELESWPADRAERISINSFGIGGVNAHAIIDSPKQCGIEPMRFPVGEERLKESQARLLLFSAQCRDAVDRSVNNDQDYLQGSRASSKDVAYTLANRRIHHSYRAYIVMNPAPAPSLSSVVRIGPVPKVAWVFTGQGAQWPEMGASLIDSNATFRHTIRRLDRFLASLPSAPPWNIEEEMRKPEHVSRVYQAEMGHPLTIAVQLGLVDVLQSWGVTPMVVLGHSSGEMAAAYASGAITAEGAIAAATFRGISNERSPRKGLMAAIGLGRGEVSPLLEAGVVIACENSQSSVTISGDALQVEKVISRVQSERPDVLARVLRVQKAFHSHHMHELGPEYERHIHQLIHSNDPKIPFYSAVTGDKLTGAGCLGAADPLLFIEIGPHPALKGPMGHVVRELGRSDTHLSTLVRQQSCEPCLLDLAGRLYQQNVALDYHQICPPGQLVTDLPQYCWKPDSSHWNEPRVAREWRFRQFPPHELLGVRVAETGNEPCWRNILAIENVPWLAGHEMEGQTVFPAGGFIAMIGEALRQLGGDWTYSLRHVTLASAAVMHLDHATEFITILSALDPDPTEKTTWYRFGVNSFDGTTWTRNCYGEARCGVNDSISMAVSESPPCFARKLNVDTWYEVLRRVGFGYSGMFQGLQHISAATTENRAAGVIPAEQGGITDTYALDPARIDQCSQISIVAAHRGIFRRYRQVGVPTFIEEVVISPTSNSLNITAEVRAVERGSYVADVVAQRAGQIFLSLKGLKVSALSKRDESTMDLPLIAQFEWRPHADFTELRDYLHCAKQCTEEWHLLEELVLACMIQTRNRAYRTDDSPEHLQKHLGWIETQLEVYQTGLNRIVSQDLRLWELCGEGLQDRIEDIILQLNGSPYDAFSIACHRMCQASAAMFAGAQDALQLLSEDNLLHNIYTLADTWDYDGLFQLIGHTNPRLKVLEVGAGTGTTTFKALKALRSSSEERLYSTYTYTDVLPGYVTAAKERFAEYEGLKYVVLDLRQDPMQQGLEPGSYDLIIASNVVHATPSLQRSLKNVRMLLKQEGRLLLQELCPETNFISYVMGFLPEWWIGQEDDRLEQPYVSPERWSRELAEAGFQTPHASMLDNIPPYHLSACMIASVANARAEPHDVTLLCHDPMAPWAQRVLHSLQRRGIRVEPLGPGNLPLPGQDVISLIDLDDPVIHAMPEAKFRSTMSMLQTLKSSLIWVTRSAQVGCSDPRAAMTLGLARTARNELAVKLYTVEIDHNRPSQTTADCITKIFCWVATRNTSEAMSSDWEYAIVENEIVTPRMHWQTVAQSFEQYSSPDQSSIKHLAIESPGLLRTMKWVDGRDAQVEGCDVLVRTQAVGLNFRDVLIASGVLDESTTLLGLEGAGIVHAVGPDVRHVSVGDHVIYMGTGCFTTYMTLNESCCIQVTKSMSFEQAAALPCVYATSAMALIEKANLQRGQAVFIHSACGGVGLAAIQVARMIGAEIYCTVGAETKVEYLVRNCNIPRSHIFHSRNSSFVKDVMDATNGRGVDVVLNSLAGDLLHASWTCVAEFGVMVEIGIRDFRRKAKLAMELFEANRTFVGLELREITRVRPWIVTDILRRCVNWIEAGVITPDPISNIFPAANIHEAFRLMQSGSHIGKIVIQMPDDPRVLGTMTVNPSPIFQQERSYLLVGGLGGLGRAVASWMVEHGARNLVFLSRTALHAVESDAFVEDLESQGCRVQLVAGSVCELVDVKKCVAQATAPIAGVLNMSMVLRDVSLEKMTFSDWVTVVEPKVQGTWNLHNVLPSNLGFFILISSCSGLCGQWGQANYAAANTFLDAFVQYRHHQGLPASVIDLGVMGDVGFVARNQNVLRQFQNTGAFVLNEDMFMQAMALAVQRSHPVATKLPTRTYSNPSQIVLGLNTAVPASSPANRVAWKNDIRFGIYRNLDRGGETSTTASSKPNSLREFLASAATQPVLLEEEAAVMKITEAIAVALADFLMRDQGSIVPTDSFSSLGIDSLVVMEIRNWVRQHLGVDRSVLTILRCPSLFKLAESIRDELLGRLSG
ncbi:type I polyketide synthase [Aspergillus aculeatinus CBS 121060]|uniref:Polyketide synthase n=1 Tax=Aspergillus aculeatinus CBS 121060 TaxID=1448322 RepID=A0ACD1GSI3_9EURO|nr:putative polyketide synthase [Aspergillus aculeatinus CBS 121060]RAH64406.1 putative polyketide synthase [Aspergillus aculeatinus CBS 121060]